MILFALFLFGAHVGSFLNVCIWRLPRGESVAHPPSRCPNCNTRLRPLDLVPLLSQILLHAKCRYCGQKISWRYAGMELLTGIVFAMVGAQSGNLSGGLTGEWIGDPVRLAQYLLVASCLIVIFWIDFETMMIPISSALLLGLAGVGADIWRVTQGSATLSDGAVFGFKMLPAPLPGSLLAMVVAAFFIWVVRAIATWWYRREAMGFGDVFMVAGIAANIGWSELIVTFFFLSVLIALFIGVVAHLPYVIDVYRRGKVRDKSRRQRGQNPLAFLLARSAFRRLEMPFGPGIAVGALVTLLYGAQLTASYVNFAYPPLAVNAPGANTANVETLFTAPGGPPAPPQ